MIRYTLREFAKELGVSIRTARSYKAVGIIPPPAEKIARGFRGEIHYWSAQQIAKTKADRIAQTEEASR